MQQEDAEKKPAKQGDDGSGQMLPGNPKDGLGGRGGGRGLGRGGGKGRRDGTGGGRGRGGGGKGGRRAT